MPAFERVKQVLDINELVSEAANWGKSLGIGSDDWSVVGADIQVVHGPTISKRRGRTEEIPATLVSPESRELVAAISTAPIEMSTTAKRFWNELDVWRKRRPKLEALARNDRSTPSEPQPRDSSDQGSFDIPWATLWKTLGAVFVISLIIFCYSYFRSSSIPGERDLTVGNVNASTSEIAPNLPVFLNNRQRQIFAELKNKGSFVLPGVPGGDGLPNDLKLFLDDLAEVIRRGNLYVIVEVYSTPAGRLQDNLATTKERAEAMKPYLIGNGRLFENQVEVIGRGSWQPLATIDKELLPPVQDQSKALIRILLRR